MISTPSALVRHAFAAFAVSMTLAGAALADEDGRAWQLDFGPAAGYYDFDAVTRFEDGGLFGLRMGVHREGWLRLEAGFEEVYTRREPLRNAARQVALGLHGRIEPPGRTIAPSLIAGIGFVLFDDSDYADAFGEAYDLGAGLAWRFVDAWRLRADFLVRYQRFRVRDPNEVPVDAVVASRRTDLWGRSVRVGVQYDLPSADAAGSWTRPLEFGVYAGGWNFSSAFRYENDAVLGLRGGVGVLPWLTLQLELDQITTSNRRTNEWAQAVSFGMHGLVELRHDRRWRPGLLVGVSFMGLDATDDIDTISEGFDIGPSVRIGGAGPVGFQADLLFRYQSVRVNRAIEEGAELEQDQIDYVWSSGLRVGLNVGF